VEVSTCKMRLTRVGYRVRLAQPILCQQFRPPSIRLTLPTLPQNSTDNQIVRTSHTTGKGAIAPATQQHRKKGLEDRFQPSSV
jgi:hypothetical protein